MGGWAGGWDGVEGERTKLTLHRASPNRAQVRTTAPNIYLGRHESVRSSGIRMRSALIRRCYLRDISNSGGRLAVRSGDGGELTSSLPPSTMLPQLSRPSVRLASLALARRPCLPSSLLARRFNSGEPASSVPVVEPTTSVPVRTRAEVAPIPPPKLDVGPARAPKEKQPQEYMMEAKWKFRKQAFSWWLLCMIPLSMLIKLTSVPPSSASCRARA